MEVVKDDIETSLLLIKVQILSEGFVTRFWLGLCNHHFSFVTIDSLFGGFLVKILYPKTNCFKDKKNVSPHVSSNYSYQLHVCFGIKTSKLFDKNLK